MKKYLIILIIFCFAACADNNFYVDFKNQSFVRSNNKGMKVVSVYPLEKMMRYKNSLIPIDEKDFYLIEYTGLDVSKDNNIYLMKPNKNYDVFFNDTLVPNGIITLKSNTKYNVVHRSIGDATPVSIVIETDKNGVIIKASNGNVSN